MSVKALMLGSPALATIALVKTSVIKLAKTLPDKLVIIDKTNAINEIIKDHLKFFHQDFINLLMVPFLGFCHCLLGGIISYLLSVFETDRLLYKSHYS